MASAGVPPDSEITGLLKQWSSGDEDALQPLMDCVYIELKKIARGHFRAERHDHTLQPTALVNEAFLKLIDQKRVDWQNRQHFYVIASKIMRRILVDYARRRGRAKRKGEKVAIEEARSGIEGSLDVVQLDDALHKLAETYPREAKVVELRYFSGMTNKEIADVLGVSLATTKRDWTFAKSWLVLELQADG